MLLSKEDDYAKKGELYVMSRGDGREGKSRVGDPSTR